MAFLISNIFFSAFGIYVIIKDHRLMHVSRKKIYTFIIQCIVNHGLGINLDIGNKVVKK